MKKEYELECIIEGDCLQYYGCEARNEEKAIEIVMNNCGYDDCEVLEVYEVKEELQ